MFRCLRNYFWPQRWLRNDRNRICTFRRLPCHSPRSCGNSPVLVPSWPAQTWETTDVCPTFFNRGERITVYILIDLYAPSHLYTYIYICIYIHTHMYIYIYVRVCVCACLILNIIGPHWIGVCWFELL